MLNYILVFNLNSGDMLLKFIKDKWNIADSPEANMHTTSKL